MSQEDRTRWERAHQARDHDARPPGSFLVENVSLLTPGRTLDVAAGSGRNAEFLAARGHRVLAVDVARSALDAIRRRRAAIDVAQMDLDHPGVRPRSLDNVMMIDFLDRRLFPLLPLWLRPGGIIVVDTFLIDQREIGHPRNPAFLLGHGELRELLKDEEVLRYREGRVSDATGTSFRAGIVARSRSGEN